MAARPPLAARTCVVAVACVVGSAACADDDSLLFAGVVPTGVAVDPEVFLGDVACSPNEGALQSFVATVSVFDDEDDTLPLTLGSSRATPCSQRVLFRNVILEGLRYAAEVDGFDRPAASLTPFGDPSSGSRQMLDVSTGEVVEPRWTTTCGQGAASATVALRNATSTLGSCEPLVDNAPGSPQLVFSGFSALGADPCTVASSFDITPLSLDGRGAGVLPASLDVPCGVERLVYDAEPGVAYRFYVSVSAEQRSEPGRSEAGGGPALGAECQAVAEAAQTVAPRCAELSATGSVELSLAQVVVAGAPLCAPGHRYDLSVDGEPLNLVPLPCEGTSNVGPFAPGAYLLGVAVYDADAQPVGAPLSCAANVEPGRVVAADCGGS